MNGSSDSSSLESGVLEELEMLLREARGARALAALGPEASLERDLGLGSLERVELLSRLEARFRKRVAETTLGEAETPRDLVRAFLDSSDVLDEAARERDAPPARSPSNALPPAATLTEALVSWALDAPDSPHIYLKEDGRPEVAIRYGELYRDALLVAGGLEARGIRQHDRVALMLPTSPGFFAAFMGTLLAGAVPVPLYPPFSRSRIHEYAVRQSRILQNAGVRAFVTVREGLAVASVLKAGSDSLDEVIDVEELCTESQALEPGARAIAATDPALIQYTSGSTGEPKGVLLTHENLLANIRAIGAALEIGPSDVGVSWLPLYHDMGLIGAWLTPLYFGIPVAILSPLAFLTGPQKWLWTIHRRRGTISPAPNFAYELAARKVGEADVEGLDLSSWRAALNGAEPVSPGTLERFRKKFEPHGFRPSSMLPVYGLAEASLLLASPVLGAELRVERVDREAFAAGGVARRAEQGGSRSGSPLSFVSVGRPIPGHEVRIVDDEGRELPERREGRLVFRGPSAMKGYFRNDAATSAIRAADGFLDSGDRAFVADGDIFVTGRAKDLIIKAGRNLVPQEIEAAASEIDGVRSGSVAAFGVEDVELGTERLVVVVESSREEALDKGRIEDDVRRAIADLVGVPPDEVVVAPPRVLPKTSSGKIRRGACREAYLRRELGRSPRLSFAPGLSVRAKLALHAVSSGATRAGGRTARLLYGLYLAPLTASFLLPAWLLAVVGLSRERFRRLAHRAARLYLAMAGIPFEVRGGERLRGRTGPFVFVANHASYLDPVPIMAALDLDYAFVVKSEAARWPFIGRFLERLAHIPVERTKMEESASSTGTMKAVLAEGRSLVLFPEGTFHRASGIRPFKLGAFKLASDSRLLVVPLGLIGTRRLLRDGTRVPRRVPIAVELGEPFAVGSSFREIQEGKEEAAEALSRLTGEPRLDLVAAGVTSSAAARG
jgi:1-acyl-sn-glycerol-3-phosphate acyltransferase